MSNDEDEGSGSNHDRWLVSYADFITLMFAFFTVLYATSTRDVEKTKQFQESVRRYLVKTGAYGGSPDKVNQSEQFTSPIEPPIQTYQKSNPLTQETFDEAEAYIEDNISDDDRKKYVKDIQIDELGVRMVVSTANLFAGDGVKFNEGALAFINKVGGLLAKVGRRVIVEGHVGQQQATPGFPSAWEFAGARSTALVRYFIKVQKMDPTLFIPISYGDQRPVSGGKTNSDQRLELVILTEDVAL